jgi:hypothetical protein
MKFACLFVVPAIVSCARGPGPVVPENRIERQMLGLLEKFDRWDLNGDGYLTLAELEPSRKLTGNSPTRIVDFYDTDKDGKITLREAQDGYARADEANLRSRS